MSRSMRKGKVTAKPQPGMLRVKWHDGIEEDIVVSAVEYQRAKVGGEVESAPLEAPVAPAEVKP